MDEPLYRVNGGIGFAFNGDNLCVKCCVSDNFSFRDSRDYGLPKEKIDNLISLLTKIQKSLNLKKSLRIQILRGPPSNAGYGSGTSLTLSAIEALLLLNEFTHSRYDILNLSGRGFTSGIGVNTYFEGGFVFDLGHKFHGQKHLPSSVARETVQHALKLVRVDMLNWKMYTLLPPNGLPISGASEIEFFSTVCPIPREDASATIYHSLLGVVASVLDRDRETFCASVNRIQKTKWKSEEINVRGESQRRAMDCLSKVSLGVGMSSLGPLIFFLSDLSEEELIFYLAEEGVAGRFMKIHPNNVGRIIHYA